MGVGSPLFRSPNDSMECPIHAKSKPKFTKAYSFGLVTGLFFLSSRPASGDWQCSTFAGPLSREATTDLKPPACCPNGGSTSPVRLSGGRRSLGLWPKQPNQRSAPDRPASAAKWSRACIVRRTSHSTARKKAKRAVFGISRVLISCNPRDALKRSDPI